MDNCVLTRRALLVEIANKVYDLNRGIGKPLSREEECYLKDWIAISNKHAEIFDRITRPDNYRHIEGFNPILEMLRLGHYCLVRDIVFKGVGTQKLLEDNDILWLMTDHMVFILPADELLPLENWANASPLNRSIYKRFVREKALLEIDEDAELENSLDTDRSWNNYAKTVFLPDLNRGFEAQGIHIRSFFRRRKKCKR